MRGAWIVLAIVLPVLTAVSVVAAVETDANKDYAVTPDVGPWMICAASFSDGETGEPPAVLAHRLVMEIRSRYGLPAYVFNRGAELRRQQEEELEQRLRQRREFLESKGLPQRIRRIRIQEQFAVLIGGYPDIESAHRELGRIKKLEPPKSVPQDGLAVGDRGQKDLKPVALNPFAQSFVVANPTVPRKQETRSNKPDPFWKQLNAGEGYSLLQCHQPWTLVIQEFAAPAVVQPETAPKSIWEEFFGPKRGDILGATAANAHELAGALRKLGFEAYVLHTRYSSVVSVGGFSAPNDPRMKQVDEAVRKLQLPPQVILLDRFLPMQVPQF